MKNRKVCKYADERLVRGKALCALDDLKQQIPAVTAKITSYSQRSDVFLPINYFIFTFIFSIGWGFCISSFDRSTSRFQSHKLKNRKSKQNKQKTAFFPFLTCPSNYRFLRYCHLVAETLTWSLLLSIYRHSKHIFYINCN